MILNCGNPPITRFGNVTLFPNSYRAKLISCRLQSCYSMLVGGTWRAIKFRLLCRPGHRLSVPLTCTRQYFSILRLFADMPNTQFFSLSLSLSLSMLLRCCCLSSKRYTMLSVRHSTTEIYFSFFTIFLKLKTAS